MTKHAINTVHRSYKYSKNKKEMAQDVQNICHLRCNYRLAGSLKCVHMVEQQLQLYCLLSYSV